MPQEIIKAVIAFLLAIVPAFVWAAIFRKKEGAKKSMSLKTFIGGAVFVAPLLAYKFLWQFFPWLNAFAYTHQFSDDFVGLANITSIPLDVLLTFLIVGVIEEVTKFMAVKVSGSEINSIDESIEMFITVALGFAFVENIIYFYNIMADRGAENILYPFVFRSLFSTFAHMMFSGMLGYYYGLAHFAGPILQEENVEKRFPFFKKIAQIFHLKNEISFKEEKLVQGFVTAIGLHALFNIFLEMNWTFLLVPYLTAGFIMLNYLLEKKEDRKVTRQLP